MGITNNAINNTSQTLAIGTGTPNDTHYILYAKKDQADVSLLRIENLNSQGRAGVIANCDSTNDPNQAACGFQQYGKNYSDQFAAANTSVIFSNAYSAGMTLACNFGKLLMIDANDVTNVSLTTTGGQYKGNNTNTAPPAGFIGEQIVQRVAAGSAVSLSNGTTLHFISITLTPGIWDINLVAGFTGTAVGTRTAVNINTTIDSNSGIAVEGDNYILTPTVSLAGSDLMLVIPQFRQLVSSNTTYYGNATCVFSGGATAAFGRLSAVRVG